MRPFVAFDQHIQLTAVGEVIFRDLPPSNPEPRSPGSQRSSVHDRLRTTGPHPLPVAVTSTMEGREPNA
jgi:hypothetical protein